MEKKTNKEMKKIEKQQKMEMFKASLTPANISKKVIAIILVLALLSTTIIGIVEIILTIIKGK